MRTKTLLLSAAALAAGLASSMAQSNVYSVNIVGYVNKQLPASTLKLVGNPLDDGTNTLTSVYAALPDLSTVYVWNGTGYTISSKAKGLWSPNLDIPTGVGMFVSSASNITNTFVGEVVGNVGSTVTNTLTGGVLTLVSSLLPYAGDLLDTNLGIGPQLPDLSTIYKWNGSNGYVISSKSKGLWSPNLTIDVGEAFFVNPASTIDWIQTLPAN